MNLKIMGSLVLFGAALTLACGSSKKTDEAAAKQSMQAYGCQW